MKKTKTSKLEIKKITLQDLDNSATEGVVGGLTTTMKTLCGPPSACTAGKGIACC
jgi:hypothetical protein